jgi:MFS family permease
MAPKWIEQYAPLPRTFWMLCITTSMFYSATHVLTTMIPLYMVHKGVGADASGQLLALFLIVSAASRPFVGKLYDETSPFRLFVLAIVLFAGGTALLLVFPNSILLLWVSRILQGLGFSVFSACSYSFLTLTIPDDLRGRGISVYSNFIKIVMAYAPGIGWVLGNAGYFKEVLAISLLFSVASYVALRQVPFQRFSPHMLHNAAETLPEPTGSSDVIAMATTTPTCPLNTKAKGKLFNMKGVPPGILIASNSVVYGALIPFVPLIVASKGLSHVEGFHVFYAFALIASRFIGGEASDKLGRLTIILPGMFVVALSLGGMFLAQTTWQFLLATVLYGLGSGVVQPSIVAMVADDSPPLERGSAMATYTMLADSGQAAGMILMGYMGNHSSFNLGLGVIALLNVAGLLYGASLMAWRKRKPLIHPSH